MTDKTTETDAPTDDLAGIKANNAELRRSLRDEKDKNRDLEARLTKIEQEREDDADSTKSEHDKALAKLQRQIDKLTGDVTDRDTRLGSLLIDNAIKEAIAANNVMPKHVEAVEALLWRKLGPKIENGEAISKDGLPLTDAIPGFFKSPQALEYVSANVGTGAGATGNTSTVAPRFTKPPVTHDELMAWDRAVKENPADMSALADSWGLPHLKP